MKKLMKALVLTDKKKMEIKEVPLPDYAENEVLINVKACGICGSDIHGYDGSTGRRQPPVIMGHEASGMIVEAGSKVRGWKVGDRVTFDSTIYCGECGNCHRGMINLCDNRRVLGVSCDDYRRDGAFAEYVAVPQHILYRLPDNVTYNQAALIEPLSVVFHAVNLTPHEIDSPVAVVGCGTIGLLLIQTLRAAGAGKIIAIDRKAERLETARIMGADHGLLLGENPLEGVFELTDGKGVPLVFEAVGVPKTLDLAIRCAKKGGTVSLIGNISPSAHFPVQHIVTRQLRLQGSCASNGEYPACLDMIARGKVNVDEIISTAAPLVEGPHWFEKLYNREGNMIKVVLNP